MSSRFITRSALAACLALQCLPAPAAAFDQLRLGVLGLGGAGTAAAPAGLEAYWNPALLGLRGSGTSATLVVQGGGKLKGDLASDLARINSASTDRNQIGDGSNPDPLAQLDWQQAGIADVATLDALFANMGRDQGSAIQADAGVGTGFAIGQFGFGVFGSLRTRVEAQADTASFMPDGQPGQAISAAELEGLFALAAHGPSSAFFSADQAGAIEGAFTAAGVSAGAAQNLRDAMDYYYATHNPAKLSAADATASLVAIAGGLGSASGLLANNQSRINLHALALTEVPFAYGHAFDVGRLGQASVGVTAKALLARIYSNSILAQGDIETAYNNLFKSYRDTLAPGLDLGVAWRPVPELTVGLTGKNLNRPRLNMVDGGKLALAPQYRLGLDYRPLAWLRAAADFDLNRVAKPFTDQQTQTLGGGLELGPDWVKLKLGGWQELADHSAPVLTTGLTLGGQALSVSLDCAAQSKGAYLNGTRVPREAHAQLALTMNF